MRFLLAAAVPFLLVPAAAQSVPTGFLVDTLISSGLGAPNDFCWLPDGRILLGNRAGSVVVFVNGTLTTIGTVPGVETGSERALLSIAADPAFATNGHIYVWYSSTADQFMHLDRFTCTGDLAVATSSNLSFAASSRRVILANVPDNAFNHNGGSTRFGPDGMLYQSIGDDANQCQAQGLTNQQGVLLRLDVSGLPAGGSLTPPAFTAIGPSSNPLGANSDFSRLVIAHGLRNPVRMTIDPNTNNVYIGDVGQNAREEYSEYVYNAGALQLVNFGWPWREGNAAVSTCSGTQPPGLVPPIADVPQTQSWFSAMGGPRYRNRGGQYDFGASYEGNAFYGDYFAGEIRMLRNTAGTWGPAPAVPGQPTATNWAQNLIGLVSFDVGPDGALYILYHNTTYPTSGGLLKRIRPIGPVDEVVIVSGDGQAGPATEPFPAPLVVQINDSNQVPRVGVPVNFAVTSGSATLSTTNPVLTDGNGRAQTTVTAGTVGGQIRITATTPGGLPSGSVATMFGRKLTLTRASNFIIMSVTNTTTVTPAQIPMVVFISAPGITPLQSIIGPICTNWFDPLTFVIEDSVGAFGFITLSGTGAIGTPNLSKLYNFPPGFLVGVTLWVQAVGLDPVTGAWRSNCEVRTL
jgi:glucose/arabinose dehydrogenase